MRKVKEGDFLGVHYQGTLDNGEVFDSSYGREPLEFQVGSGAVIAGFEKAALGLSLGEKRDFTLQPEDAYGPRDESLVMDFPRESAGGEFTGSIGATVHVHLKNGQQIPARVTAINDGKITLDLNPPLAGSILNFSIEVVYIGNSAKSGGSCGCGCSSAGCDGC